MKIKVEIDENLEEEIIIRSKSFSEELQRLQKAVTEVVQMGQKFAFYKGDVEYYISIEQILFFETEGNIVYAHTESETYGTKYRLYEWEELLPGFFMRISKSTILNIKHIYAINRSLSTSCVVQFPNTHKQVYVSRYYYKPLRNRLEEKR